jgi:choline kinase
MLETLVGAVVVVDMRSHYVCLGKLESVHELYLEMCDADLHDLRDTRTSRENYIAASLSTGIKRNRRRLLLVRADVVAISRAEDVVDE